MEKAEGKQGKNGVTLVIQRPYKGPVLNAITFGTPNLKEAFKP